MKNNRNNEGKYGNKKLLINSIKRKEKSNKETKEKR